MEEINLNSWRDFAPTVEAIRSDHPSPRRDSLKEPILFRGQSDSSFGLQTTLERATPGRQWSVAEYAAVSAGCRSELETFSGRRFDLDCEDVDAITQALSSNGSKWLPFLPNLSYTVYLRHHGFPSPLLDWSASAYVAAFFAFEERPRSDEVAVFAYWGRRSGGLGGGVDTAHLTRFGQRVGSTVRHFSQQCWYTVATMYESGQHFFAPHASADQNLEHAAKITLPATERLAALRQLREYNITRFTLFHTEDDLVRTLAFEELELRGA